jgi:hypothetical protein
MNADAKPKAPIQQPTQMAIRTDERLAAKAIKPRGPDERLDALIQFTRDIVAVCVRADQTAIAMNEQISALVEAQARTDEHIPLFIARNGSNRREGSNYERDS